MKLFDSDDENTAKELSKIEVNQEFAKRFEHNKKREDLQRFQELKKQGHIDDSDNDSESDSSESDQNEDINLIKEDQAFWNALILAKNKDPILKQKDVKLFTSSESRDDEESEYEVEKEVTSKNDKAKGEGKKKSKPKYLKDVNAEHLIEMGPEFEEGEDEENDKIKVKSYTQEQEELRRQVLDALDAEDRDVDEGVFLREKGKETEEKEKGDGKVEKKLDEYFGNDEKLDENAMFLKNFFKNKMWIDKEGGKSPPVDEVVGLSDDEEELERQERHEKEWNFRFEEGAGDRVETHARVMADSVRKKDNARKEQRRRKKERMQQAELERQEEVKRLKNIKKKDIMEKIYKIREVAGLGGGHIPLTEADLEGDFDPEEYDKKMKAAFGKEYYDAEDIDPEFGSDRDEGGSDLEKPDFEKEDKLLGLAENWDTCSNPGGVFLSEWEKYKAEQGKGHESDENEEREQVVEHEQEEPGESKRKKKRKMPLKEKIDLDKELEELYKLDYEDAIGDLKTRFKYKQVNPKRYGLRTEDILLLDDKELNQFVSVKKLAPYREQEWTVPYNKIVDLKKKKKEKLENWNVDGGWHKKSKKETRDRARNDTDVTVKQEDGKAHGKDTKSRKARRRERNAEFKLDEKRKMAYGQIPSKSKKLKR